MEPAPRFAWWRNSTHLEACGGGAFLSLDGPDGCGKSTQVARLVDWLRACGNRVVACRDPGGTHLGDRLRALLLDRSNDNLTISMRAEMLMYMTSRAQLVEEVILPALRAGVIVVSDRYLLANVVYQGYAGGLPIEQLWQVGLAATGGLLPDLTLVLDVPIETAAARLGSPRDRIESRSADYKQRVRAGYLEALRTYPAPHALIDASNDMDTVTRQIQAEVMRGLGLVARP